MSLLLALAGAVTPPEQPLPTPSGGGGVYIGRGKFDDTALNEEIWQTMMQLAIVAVAAAGGFDG